MKIKLILAATLVILIVLGMLLYGYIAYTLTSDTDAKKVVISHQMLFYGLLVVQLLQFILSGVMVYES